MSLTCLLIEFILLTRYVIDVFIDWIHLAYTICHWRVYWLNSSCSHDMSLTCVLIELILLIRYVIDVCIDWINLAYTICHWRVYWLNSSCLHDMSLTSQCLLIESILLTRLSLTCVMIEYILLTRYVIDMCIDWFHLAHTICHWRVYWLNPSWLIDWTQGLWEDLSIFVDDISKLIENIWISITIALAFINDKSTSRP